MRRADRLFQLVQLLRAKRITTAADLAADLGVSTRTVYRDVRDLEDSGIPIEGEAGVGYRLQRGYELPPMTFTPDELEALALGARMVEAWGDPDLGLAARSVLTKVRAVLPDGLTPVLDGTALFAMPRQWGGTVTRGLSTLREAITTRRKLRITYARRDDEVTERVICPVGLYFWGTTWTLAAWCELRRGYRNFRPDRIRAIARCDDRWSAEGGPDLEGFLDEMTRQASTGP